MTPYLDPTKLRENLAALDNASLRERVADGQLTPEAHAIALEILTQRNQAADLPSKPSTERLATYSSDRTAQRALLDRVFIAYILLLVVCIFVILADPPWVAPHGGGWQGTFGYLSGLVAGLPWTFLAAQTIMTGSALSFWSCTFLAVIVNVTIILVLRSRVS